jgi:hypothetical protein
MESNLTSTALDISLELKVLGFPAQRLSGLATEALNKPVEDFSSLPHYEQTRVFRYAREMAVKK